MKRIFTSTLLCAAMMASAQTPGTVISEQPSGASADYDMHYSGYYINYDKIEYAEDLVLPTTIVMADDGYVYFKNLFAFMPTETWVKGEMGDEGTVRIQLPQTIYYENDENYGESWMDLNIFYTPNLDEAVPEPVTDPDANTIEFTIQEDGSLLLDPYVDGYSISCISQPDGMWMAFSITDISFTEAQAAGTVTPPEGLTGKKYSYITYGFGNKAPEPKDFGYRMEFIEDGADVYIGGMSLDMPSAWVKARRDGDRIIIPNNQYMGNYSGLLDIYLQYCKYDPRALGEYSLLPDATEFVYIVDDAAGTITPADPDVIMIINAPKEGQPIRFLQMLDEPTLLYQPEAKGTPMPAWNIRYRERRKGDNFDLLSFNLPMLSTDGVLLDRENMYYRLYMDGEQVEILDEDFDSGVDMWDIPYDFDRYLIVCNRMNTAHEMGIRVSGYDTLGIQCVNVWDGETYESEIMTVDLEGNVSSSGVGRVEDDAEVESVSLFDLDGRPVAGNARGILVKREVLSDGSVRHSKLLVK